MNAKRGFAPLILLVIIAVVAIGGGAYYYSQHKPTTDAITKKSDGVPTLNIKATTNAASHVNGPGNTVALKGTVTPDLTTSRPQKLEFTYWFEYGTTESLGLKTEVKTYSENIPQEGGFSADIDAWQELNQGVTYYYKLVIQMSDGTTIQGNVNKYIQQSAKTVDNKQAVTKPTPSLATDCGVSTFFQNQANLQNGDAVQYDESFKCVGKSQLTTCTNVKAEAYLQENTYDYEVYKSPSGACTFKVTAKTGTAKGKYIACPVKAAATSLQAQNTSKDVYSLPQGAFAGLLFGSTAIGIELSSQSTTHNLSSQCTSNII